MEGLTNGLLMKRPGRLPHACCVSKPGGILPFPVDRFRWWGSTAGTYAMTDSDSAPWASEELRGMMLHPDLPIIYVCYQRVSKVCIR